MENYSQENLRPSRRKSKDKKFTVSHFLIIWLIALFVLNFFLYFNKKKNEFKEKTKEIVTLEAEIMQLKQKKSSLEQEIYYLNTDKGIEDTARKKLGLVKKNEIAVIVLDEKNRKIENFEDLKKDDAKKSVNTKPKGIVDKILKFLHIIK